MVRAREYHRAVVMRDPVCLSTERLLLRPFAQDDRVHSGSREDR
jgi:hypothetical protein